MASVSANVALQLVRLAEPVVSMHPRPSILDPVVRAGLLVDLALDDALVNSSAEGLEVDTDPTGFGPADKLLSGVIRHPDKPLVWWLYHAPITVNDIADELVADGTWQRHGHGPLHRYRANRPEQRGNELHRLAQAHRHHPAGERESATAALLDLLPLTDVSGQLGHGFVDDDHGKAGWLLPDLLDNLKQQQARVNAAGRDAQRANSLTYLI